MEKTVSLCLLLALLLGMLVPGATPAFASTDAGDDMPPDEYFGDIGAIELDELPDADILEPVGVGDLKIALDSPESIEIGNPAPTLEALDDIPLTMDAPLQSDDPEAASGEALPRSNAKSDDDLRSGFYYYRIENGEAVITDVEEEPTYDEDGDQTGWDKLQYVDVVIPDSIDGCPVTRIGSDVFEDARNLWRVVLPASLKEIGNDAFADCESLSDITLPDGLELLDCDAFCNCVSLKSINIPLGVKTHPYVTEHAYPGPFSGSGLSEVRFADGIVSVEPGLFQNCTSLQSLTLPDSIVEISRGAFMGSGLQRIGLPAGLKRINWAAFSGCESLSDITLPAGLEYLDCFVFDGCESLQRINLPKDVSCHEYVTEHAYSGPFVNCENLREVTFAEGMKVVPRGIFFRCPGIQSIALPNTIETIEGGAFESCYNLVTVSIPNSVTRINDYAFSWCESLKDVKLPANLTYLGLGAFKGCTSLAAINIPAKVEMHGYVAANSYYPGPFSECEGLKTVTFAKGMTRIPNGLFYQCNGIEKITLPDSVVEIGNDAFCRCSALAEIHIKKKVTSIGSYAFYGCNALKDVYYGASKASWNRIEIDDNNEALADATLHTDESEAAAPKTSLKKAKITVAGATFTGKALKPKVTVKLNGKALKSKTDYKLTYSNNIEPGKGKVTVTGKGNYTGSASATFKIAKGKGVKVSFDAMKGKVTPAYRWVLSGKAYGTLPKATRKGFVFKGWYTEKSNGAKVTSKTVVSGKKNRTLYARWNKIYKITYVLNDNGEGGNRPANPTVYTAEDSVTFVDPIRIGFAFEGWFSDKKLTKPVTGIKKGTKGNLTLYAKWRERHIYILSIGGGHNTANDIEMIGKRLKKNKLSGYTVKKPSIYTNKYPTRQFYDDKIKEAFKGTRNEDLSFVYLHGHGHANSKGTGLGLGILEVDSDGNLSKVLAYPYLEVLKTLTSNISGQIIFLPDACFSGGFVQTARDNDFPGKDRISIISSSSITQPSNDIGYEFFTTVIEAAKKKFKLEWLPENDAGYGRYTVALEKGLKNNRADQNGDGISIHELYQWIEQDTDVKKANQRVELFSENQNLIIFQ